MRLENEKCSNTFLCALRGIKATIKTEQNFRVDLIIATIVVAMGFILRINFIEWLFCVISIGLVLFAEMMNTAVETVVDLYTREKNELAKKAKDISAGAVLILAINTAIVGCVIFIPKIIALFWGS